MRAYVGIDVQRLTASISKATGATSGLIVTWVDSRGPAAGVVRPGECIEAANGAAISTTDEWDVHVARLAVARHSSSVFATRAAAVTCRLSDLQRRPTIRPRSPDAAAVAGNRRRSRSVDPGSAGDRSGLLRAM